MDPDLCFIPDVNIDDDDAGEADRRLAYLRSIIRERRQDGDCAWSFGFDFSGSNHAHGIVYVVDSRPGSTRVWELSKKHEEWNGTPRAGRRRLSMEPPPGQQVAHVPKGLFQLEAEDLVAAMAEIMAGRIFDA